MIEKWIGKSTKKPVKIRHSLNFIAKIHHEYKNLAKIATVHQGIVALCPVSAWESHCWTPRGGLG
jgi:hypothetical protein